MEDQRLLEHNGQHYQTAPGRKQFTKAPTSTAGVYVDSHP